MKKIQFLVIPMLLFLFTTLTSCKKDNDIRVPEETFVFQKILSSSSFSILSPQIPKQQLIIKNLVEWELILAKMTSDDQTKCKLETADFDFNKYWIVVAVDEFKHSTGYEVIITDVIEHINKIAITIKYTGPIFTSGAANSQPFHIIKIHKTDKPIEFN